MNSLSAQPIGVFDSGIGGLTVLEQLFNYLPQERFIYCGDTARVPYGNKSAQTILRYSNEIAQFLVEKNVKLLICACNTASALALPLLSPTFSIPLLGVIEPGVQAVLNASQSKRIGIIGTKGTIDSQVYQEKLLAHWPTATIFSVACPLLVPLVEENFSAHSAARLILQDYLAPLKQADIDTLLLGCTHYPFLKALIKEELGPKVQIVDSARECAKAAFNLLYDSSYSSKERSNSIECEFFVSDDPERFKFMSQRLLGWSLTDVQVFSPDQFFIVRSY